MQRSSPSPPPCPPHTQPAAPLRKAHGQRGGRAHRARPQGYATSARPPTELLPPKLMRSHTVAPQRGETSEDYGSGSV